jgi:hypothetical protein
MPEIREADYPAFRALIKLLPASYDAWRIYHIVALKKRGARAVVQVVALDQFRAHMKRCDPKAATLSELFRCATELASRAVSTLAARVRWVCCARNRLGARPLFRRQPRGAGGVGQGSVAKFAFDAASEYRTP